MALTDELARRKTPPIFSNEAERLNWQAKREELLEIMSSKVYGRTPPAPKSVEAETVEVVRDYYIYAGLVTCKKIVLSFDTPKGKFSFPFHLILPNTIEKPPVILHIAFSNDLPHKWIPLEEITDRGYAIAQFCYSDIVEDSHDGNFDQGLLAHYREAGSPRKPDEWGKIGAWAFAASRVMDYLQTLDEVDTEHISIIGHSRLGKTALWCSAQDERFFATISNNSGVTGAALFKHGTGETIKDYISAGSWDWFCDTFKGFSGKENELDFDQHYLLALIAPRLLYVGSAEEDPHADPKSEFLSCVAIDGVYRLLGEDGFYSPAEFPKAPYHTHGGSVGYHIRKGEHFLSRYDWNLYMDFIDEKMSIKNDLKKRSIAPIFKTPEERLDWPAKRAELFEIMVRNVYGRTPPAPDKVQGEVLEELNNEYAGKVIHKKIRIYFDTPKGNFEFPVNLLLPKAVKRPPVILHISGTHDLPHRSIPLEEILDHGFALLHYCYEDVVPDTCDGNFDIGLIGHYREKGAPRKPDEWGKIGAWAFSASRIMDYLETLDEIDSKHVAVLGQSRLGKAALWCGAQDPRFFVTMSNNSGVAGAALTKGGTGEPIEAFVLGGSWDWFCDTFKGFSGKENELDFDQHYLLALIAPRFLSVASAEDDPNADPKSELLSCVAASEVYNLLGLEGIKAPQEYPKAPFEAHEGHVGYHIRKGEHCLNRTDWNKHIDFMESKIKLGY